MIREALLDGIGLGLPQIMCSLALLGLSGTFGALLVDRLVVVVHGLYLARHLFTIYKQISGFQNWSVVDVFYALYHFVCHKYT